MQTLAITELRTLSWYQMNNFIVLTLAKADTMNFSYSIIMKNCTLYYCFHIHFHRVFTISFTMWVRFHIPFHMIFHIIIIFSHPFSQGGYLFLYQVNKISHGFSHNHCFHIHFHRVVNLPCDKSFTCPFTGCFTSYTVKYLVNTRSPFHMFISHEFSHFCEILCEKLCENHVKIL